MSNPLLNLPNKMPDLGPNPLQRALDNYHEMEARCRQLEEQCTTLRQRNVEMATENGVLREALDKSDTERMRLQNISSVLMGRLMAINDTIAGAVKMSLQQTIPVDTSEEDLERIGAEVREATQRADLGLPPETPDDRKATQAPPQGLAGASVPRNEFSPGVERLVPRAIEREYLR